MPFFHKISVVVEKSDKVAWSRHVEMKSKWLCLDDAKSKTACLIFPSTCCYLGNQPASNESIVINASSAIVKDDVVAAGEYNLQKKNAYFL